MRGESGESGASSCGSCVASPRPLTRPSDLPRLAICLSGNVLYVLRDFLILPCALKDAAPSSAATQERRARIWWTHESQHWFCRNKAKWE